MSRLARPRRGNIGRVWFRWIRQGKLEVRIGGRYPLDQAARAHEDLAARRTTGKLILLSR